MNHQAQLVSSFQQLSEATLDNHLSYHYGKVLELTTKDTCLVELPDSGLQVEVNLRVGQHALTNAFVVYPVKGSQILFLSDDQNFGRAYMIQCSEVQEIHLRGNAFGGLIDIAKLTEKINCAIEQLNNNISALKTAIGAHVHPAPNAPATAPPVPPDPKSPPPADPPANPALIINTSNATPLVRNNYENTTIKHGAEGSTAEECPPPSQSSTSETSPSDSTNQQTPPQA